MKMERRPSRKCKSVYSHAKGKIVDGKNVEVCVTPSLYYKCQPMKRRRPPCEEDDSHWLLGQRPLPRVKQLSLERVLTSDVEPPELQPAEVRSREVAEDSKADVQAKIASAMPKKKSRRGKLCSVKVKAISVNTRSTRSNPEEPSLENIMSDNATPENSNPEQASLEHDRPDNATPEDTSQEKSVQHNSSPAAKRLDSGLGSELGSGSETMEEDGWPSPIASRSSGNDDNPASEISEGHSDKSYGVNGHDDIEAEHLQAMAGIELLRSRVRELKRTKLELERTKMELCEVREEARKDMEELERRAHANMTATVEREVEAIKKQAERDLDALRKESQTRQEELTRQAEEDRLALEKWANNQFTILRKQADKELELERNKARKNEQAAVQATEEKLLRKMDSMQRKLQGKADAAEKEQKKAAEEVRREAKREIEGYQRTAEQAVIRYNKLIAEYNVLEGRISDAARLLSPMSSAVVLKGVTKS